MNDVKYPLSLEFIDEHIGADEGDREAVIALVREVEAAHGITARTVEGKAVDFPTIRVRRASEEALMRQADEDGRFLNAQGHQQAIDAIDFCLSEFSRADAACALRGAQKESGWINAQDSLPPCDGETMFIGENEAGYIACFNRLTADGYCFHDTAEGGICVMSGLRMWKRVDRPSAPTPEGEAK